MPGVRRLRCLWTRQGMGLIWTFGLSVSGSVCVLPATSEGVGTSTVTVLDGESWTTVFVECSVSSGSVTMTAVDVMDVGVTVTSVPFAVQASQPLFSGGALGGTLAKGMESAGGTPFVLTVDMAPSGFGRTFELSGGGRCVFGATSGWVDTLSVVDGGSVIECDSWAHVW